MKGFSMAIAGTLALGLIGGSGLFAQASSTGDTSPVATTGSIQVDAALSRVNAGALQDPAALMERLSLEFNVSTSALDGLLADGYKPGEIMLALEFSRASGKSLSEVVAMTQGHAGHGWGLVAEELGLQPGSKALGALAKNMEKNAVEHRIVAGEGDGTGSGSASKGGAEANRAESGGGGSHAAGVHAGGGAGASGGPKR